VHAFMDEYNFDLERAKKCCITQIMPDGQMVPFCVHNILYRHNDRETSVHQESANGGINDGQP